MIISHRFNVYDYFRPTFWGNTEVDFWYQQNTFLCVRKNSFLNNTLIKKGIMPLVDIDFMNCVHPSLYELSLRRNMGVKKYIKSLVKELVIRQSNF